MEIKPVVSKKAHLLAELYDLTHVPAFTEPSSPLYLFYHGETSNLLYYGYLFETRELWRRMFDELIGVKVGGEAEKYLEELEGINVYRWGEVEELLKSHGGELVALYSSKKGRIIDLIGRVLDIEFFFDKVYVILAFNPLRGLYGSLPVYDREHGYAVASIFVSPDTGVEKTLDMLIHEIMHGLIRVNEVDVPEEVEEEFIDTLCPEGYLSRELGLTSEINVEKSSLSSIVEKYFTNKLYRETSLVEYIKRYQLNDYHL